MKCDVTISTRATIELKPGDVVVLDKMTTDIWGRPVRVERIVESRKTLYAIFSNKTWRPLSSYGRTWMKAN